MTRQTVNGWRNRNPWFQAELNRRRQETWGAAVDQLRALLPRAVAVLAEELETGDARAKVAVDILRLAGLDRARAPQKLDTFLVGPTDATAIIDGVVHHIIPGSMAQKHGLTKKEANDRSNAVGLCPNCHWARGGRAWP